MNLADNLKRIRKENNLSQEQLAEQLGVSRQSVSKWESGQAYPEMDKVLQLSRMFNLNIDDLLNQDIKEISKEKQSKLMINKYIDDFLAFITKTIDMFCSMRFKQKIKCLFEQCVIGCLLFILFLLFGTICSEVLYGILSIFPYMVRNVIYSICESIYFVFAFTFGTILLVHIFKVRYLDYYIIVKEKDETLNEENAQGIVGDSKQSKKVYLEKKKEEIIIRDPKHSEYRFISGVLKGLLFIVKGFTLLIAICFCLSLICFVMSFIISFLIIKTGVFFLGVILALIACIIVNIIILFTLFNFILNKKTNLKVLLFIFIGSIILFGIGIGLGVIGFTNFDYIDDTNNSLVYKADEFIVSMREDLVLCDLYHGYNSIEYVVDNRSDVKIVYKHTELFDIYHRVEDNYLYLDVISSDSNYFKMSREIISDINNRKIIDYDNFKIYVYASEENINKLKNNHHNHLDDAYRHYNLY